MAKKAGDKKAKKGPEFWTALDRVLSHAESHGDVYPGATADHATVRAAMAADREAEDALAEQEATAAEDAARERAESEGSEGSGE